MNDERAFLLLPTIKSRFFYEGKKREKRNFSSQNFQQSRVGGVHESLTGHGHPTNAV